MPAESIVTTVGERTLTLTNLDKVLYPACHFTKAEIVSYYLAIADTMLPHLAGRCLTRVRFPNGVDEQPFFEKNMPAGAPDWLSVQPVLGTEGRIEYLVAGEPAALVYLANLAALELHAPQWTTANTTIVDGAVQLAADVEPRATTCLIDLDPGPGMTIVEVSKGALLIAARLAADGLIAAVKTSGSKGLQLSAPIAPTPSEEVVRYVARLAAELSRAHPDLFVATMAKSARSERIYIDYLQNKAARNTICAYSLRGKEQPWVATPLTWDEVAAADSPDALRFRPDDVLARVADSGDLFADVLAADGPSLPRVESGG
jgi:bifunctional non-homologous end joining protein LigD